MGRDVYIVRIGIVFVLFLCGFCTLSAHLHTLQVTRHEELAEAARQKYTGRRVLVGNRGVIYDVRGNLLAGNLACKDVLAEPRLFPPALREQIITTLADTLGLDAEELRRRLSDHRDPTVNSGPMEVVVDRGVPLDRATALNQVVLVPGPKAKTGLPGVRLVDSEHRYYPKHELLANTLGFTDANNRGVYGLEQYWDKALQAQTAKYTYDRDRQGRRVYRETPVEVKPADGKNLYLTIDEPLQQIVEQELANIAAEHRPLRAYAVMANPHTGAILAMAQYPNFDPNERGKMDPGSWRSHLVSDVFDPGSIMKGCTISGALDYGVVTLDTTIDCENGMWFYAGKSLRDDHKAGKLHVSEVVMKSSNIGTAKIALMMGPERLYQVLRRFGFGEPTGLGVAEESRGILKPTKRWDGLSITRYPIGQGVSVTALQMLQAYCAIANDGNMMQLHLVDRITDPNTGDTTVTQPVLKRTVARSAAITEITKALCLVTTEEGTALKAAVPGYHVAGKTGTAQKLVNGSYESRKYIASFVGFVPAEDPALTLIVVIDEPSAGKYYGGTVAAPAWRRIAEQTLRYLNVPPDPALLKPTDKALDGTPPSLAAVP